MQAFCPRIDMLKGNRCILRIGGAHCQKEPKSYFQSQFWMTKNNRIFSKKFDYSKNINLGDHYLLKLFFLNSIFEPLYFLKLRPIFDRLSLLVGIFKRFFLGGMLILCQKPYFLGPTIFKIPQPN